MSMKPLRKSNTSIKKTVINSEGCSVVLPSVISFGKIQNFQVNSQAPDLPCAAVGHVFRLSRLRFGCYPETVKKYPH